MCDLCCLSEAPCEVPPGEEDGREEEARWAEGTQKEGVVYCRDTQKSVLGGCILVYQNECSMHVYMCTCLLQCSIRQSALLLCTYMYQSRQESVVIAESTTDGAVVCSAVSMTDSSFCRLSAVAVVNSGIVGGCLVRNTT